MAKIEPANRRLLTLDTAKLGDAPDGFEAVQGFLHRFGYLPEETLALEKGTLEDTTSTALASYQAFHGLEVTGLFDEATREMMSRSRCGIPDMRDGAPLFSAGCAWNKTSLTYAFENGTADVAGEAEKAAVRAAFATWSASIQIAFREVGTGDSPDIRIGWRQANCGDANMTGGVLAHADYPPGCGYYGNALPRPFHFDDQEHAWCIGAVAGQYDIETVSLHEIGHLLGLYHSNVAGAVMWPSVRDNATLRTLTADDIEGVRKLYPPTGPIFVRHSGKVLDVEGGSTADGADAIQWDYWGGQNQIFKVEWVEAGHYRIVAQHSGKVLDDDGVSTADAAQIHQWGWWGGNNQKFRLDPVGGGYYRLAPRHSGKAADVYGSNTANGAKVIQWGWWGGNNQQWRLGPARITPLHSGKAIDVAGLSLANGAVVHQWDYWGGGNQKFRLDPVGGGYYRIMIEHSGKCLDVEGASTADGACVIQWEYWGGNNQKFKPEPVGNGYYRLVAAHSGKVLDVYGGSTGNGAGIIQWGWWGGNNQRFRL